MDIERAMQRLTEAGGEHGQTTTMSQYGTSKMQGVASQTLSVSVVC
jgi:hypothetical protein